jgi:hypothetical protein
MMILAPIIFLLYLFDATWYHTALDVASILCFSGILLEFIPMKIGSRMTNIAKEFMTQHIRLREGGRLWKKRQF